MRFGRGVVDPLGRLGSAACLAIVLAGCGPELPPLVAESPHMTLHMNVAPDEGLADWLEFVATSYGDFFGVADPQVDIFVFADARSACGIPAGRGISGCALGDEVWSNTPYMAHEIVHAVAARVGSPPLWLTEGIADAIGGGLSRSDYRVSPTMELGGWLTTDGWNAGGWETTRSHYDVAASFVRFIMRTYGRDAFLALYRTLPREASDATQRAAFESACGVSIDDALSAWVAEGEQSWNAILEPVPECSTEALAPGPITISSGPRTFFYSGEAVQFRTFDVASPTRVAYSWLRDDIDLRASMRVYGCATDLHYTGTPTRSLSEEAPLGLIDLRPGRYVFVIGLQQPVEPAPPSEATTIELRIESHPSEVCDPATTVLDDLGIVYLNPGAAVDFDACPACEARYALSSATGRRVRIRPANGLDPEPHVQALLCSAPCELATACSPLSVTAGEMVFDLGAGSEVHLLLRPLATADLFSAQLRIEPI